MACLRSKFRHLYLLALFQLVGGPLVLVPMLMMSKAVVRETAQHGVVQGLHEVVVSEEWSDVREMIRKGGVVSELSTPTKAPAPGKQEKHKAKDGKSKLDFVSWIVFIALIEREGDPVKRPAWEWQPMASNWANAPPSPPPRVV